MDRIGYGRGGHTCPERCYRSWGWCIPKAHEGAVRVIAWSLDGSAVASGGEDAIIKVWEATTGTILALYTKHTGPICVLDWSPDGCWMTSAESASSPHVWQLHRENTASSRG